MQHSLNQPQSFLRFKIFLDFHRRPTTFFLDMATIALTTKPRVIERAYVALGLYCTVVVKFTDDVYRSLSDDTIITSSSDKTIKRIWYALKGNVLIAQQGKRFWRKQW